MHLPEIFKAQFDELLSEQEQKALFETIESGEASTSVRYHPLKKVSDLVIPAKAGIPWSEYGYTLPVRPDFTHDPLFQAGVYYVQDASTQLLEYFINEIRKEHKIETILDLCAAPGGKTTHLLSLLGEDTLVVANEVIATRTKILHENTVKWGYPNLVLLNKDPKYLSHVPDFFDCIVVDAPCSGEGLFRKDPDAVAEWSPELVMQCSLRQKRILSDALITLKPGGYLIYSTCTYNYLEDELIVEWLQEDFGFEGLAFDPPEEWNLYESEATDATCYRTFPHRTEGEGFFIAVLRKPLDQKAVKPVRDRKSAITLKPTVEKTVSTWLKDPKKYVLYEEKGSIMAFPKQHQENFQNLAKELWPDSFGIRVAEKKGKDIVPTHELALSTILCPDAFPTLEVSREVAQLYQKKEPVIPAEAGIHNKSGYVLLTYQNLPLGFVKVSGKKVSNLYPMEWRVRR